MVLRKLLHLSFIALLFLFKRIPYNHAFAILIGLSIIALSVEIARLYSKSFYQKFNSFLGPLLKEKEKKGSLTGATYLFLSFLIVFMLFPFKVFFYASLIAILVDGITPVLTALIFKKNSKDHIHFLVFCISAVIVALVINSGLPIWVKLVASVFIAILEYLDLPPDDNFWAELGGAFIIYILILLK